MTFEPDNQRLSRRAVLRAGLLSAFSLPLLAQSLGASADDPPAPPVKPKRGKNIYAPFRVGLQSYSLRHFSFDDMLAKTQELGLHYLEAYPGHMAMTDDPKILADYQQKLKAHDIKLVGYGVVDFSADEADARKKFAFARTMGIEVLSAYPKPEAFPVLDKLVDEFKVNIGIHNHGPGDNMYDLEEKLQKAIEGHNPRIGSCNDTGHYLRSGVNPVLVARDLGPRLYDIHLKNVKQGENGQKEFTEIGATGGLLDTVALFRKLVDIKYKGAIMLEYEEHPEDPMPQIKECLAATARFAQTVHKLGLTPSNA